MLLNLSLINTKNTDKIDMLASRIADLNKINKEKNIEINKKRGMVGKL